MKHTEKHEITKTKFLHAWHKYIEKVALNWHKNEDADKLKEELEILEKQYFNIK